MRALVAFIRRVIGNTFLIRMLVARDLRNRYVGSALGIAWLLLSPLLTLITYTIVFSLIFRVRITGLLNGVEVVIPYAVWFLAGQLAWSLFADTANASPNTIVNNRQLITKSVFPSEVLPLSVVLSKGFNHLIGLAILAVMMVVFKVAPGYTLVALPYFFIPLFLCSLGVGWFVSSTNVYFKDIGHVLPVVMQLGFYYSSVIFRPEMIPARFQWILQINPLYFCVEGYRSAILGAYNNPVVWKWEYGLYAYGVAAGVFLLGGFVFRKLKKNFPDIL